MTPADPGRANAAPRLVLLLAALVFVLGPGLQLFDGAQGHPNEEAYRSNNLGVARLEQFDYPAAVEAFRQALAQDASLTIARVNLAIALFYAGDLAAARREAEAAAKGASSLPHPTYLLGLVARAENRTEDALAAFARVRQLDAGDPGAATNLGQIYLQERKYSDAADLFRAALQAEPYNVTAAYGLATALVRSGSREQGAEAMARFQKLRDAPYATTFSQSYLEQGRYAEAIASTGAEPELVDERAPQVAFTDATAEMLPKVERLGGTPPHGEPFVVTLFDLENDGDLDIAAPAVNGLWLFKNDAGRFADATESAGLPGRGGLPVTAVLAGDYDNDQRPDLCLLRSGGISLFRQSDGGRFQDVTERAGIAQYPRLPRAAAWLDADHDGDLDLFLTAWSDVAGSGGAGTPARLLRNNGTGTFVDITSQAGLDLRASVVAVAPTDYDNRRDIDVIVAAEDRAPMIFRNLRDGSFRDTAADAGLTTAARYTSMAVADVNKDGFTDIFLGRSGGAGLFAFSDGRGGFSVEPGMASTTETLAAQFVDYDNDGLLDLLALTAAGPRLLRNVGRRWIDVTDRALPASLQVNPIGIPSLATGDLDGDGDADAVVRREPGVLQIWRNDGGSRNRSLRVRLTARVSNRSASGAKVEMRAGSLRQKLETSTASPQVAPADINFGLGSRPGADVVRVLWPAGILQAETPERPPRTLTVEELDRKPSSCPYLYTWNGGRFEFVTDFLGGGEMGYLVAPGVRNRPDPDEYVRIESTQLREREGRYELRVTNELEETLFLDRTQLVVVDHPAAVDVYPNEGLVHEPAAFVLHGTRGAAPPLAAVDEHGHDVLDRVSRLDRRYPDDFTLERIRGYAAPHEVMVTLPPSPDNRRLMLLTGWTDYAFSGDNFAASQAGLKLVPPFLEFRDDRGQWRTAIEDVGIPVGRPQTIVVELTGKVPPTAREVRISTTMRIYWDRILIARADSAVGRTTGGSIAGGGLAVTRLDPARAELRWRGFSAETTPDGHEPYGYDYAHVSSVSPWKLMPGRYTREGAVRELLVQTDDMFVVSRPGDEIALSFDAGGLPPLAAGRSRTFLFYADGFSKEMDLHSASPDASGPLPFHGMTGYPYAAPEAYPSTPAHREYLDRYNTRIVPRMLPPLEKGDSHLFPAGGKR